MLSREAQLSNWLSSLFPKKTLSLQSLAGDASFRRYYRCYYPEGTYIVVDAPPEKETNSAAFAAIAHAFYAHKIHVPQIHHSDIEKGFLLIDDFGDTTYLQAFKTENPHVLYQQAIKTLIQIQQVSNPTLLSFDDNFMLIELERFNDWFIHQLLGISLKRSEQAILDEAYSRIIQSAVSQPQVVIHRDYHSRNLMLTPNHSTGVLDFQDAMIGPLTYDLVSLLKDCYIAWPDSLVDVWAAYYFHEAKSAELIQRPITETQFIHAFDLMGIQRHCKALFIFARLHLLYQKPAYLNDIPRTLQYLLTTTNRYEEFEAFHWLLQTVILPRFLFPSSPSFQLQMTPRTTIASLDLLCSQQ